MDIRTSVARLGTDVWYLILQYLSDRKDLSSLCLVCRGLNALATQFLYRTIPIGPLLNDNYKRHRGVPRKKESEKSKSEAQKWAETLTLVRRLAAQSDEPKNRAQTRAVREIDIVSMRYGWDYVDGDSDFLSDDEGKAINNEGGAQMPNRLGPKFEKELPGFVSALPNLGKVQIPPSPPSFEALFRALAEHPNKPEIHLLGERGHRTVSGPLPGVVSIKSNASPYGDTPETPNTEVPDIQKLFFACPDLKTFSLSVANRYGGCVSPPIYHAIIRTFMFTSGNAVKFPPLESLSLSGYAMGDEEWPHWRDGLDWSRLKTLKLGPDPMYASGPTMADLLSRFEGYANRLQTLTVETWAAEGDETCPPLLSFLGSFDTLEALTVRRHFIPVQKLAHHRKLKHLCLHCMEVKRPEGAFRPTFGVDDLALLDKVCPDLQTLEVDITRTASGDWPKEIIEILAFSFPNLRELTLHCEIGIDFWVSFGYLPSASRQTEQVALVLDDALVRTFAEPFFAARGTSRMKTLTIKTGESLRRFPQWHPGYRHVEEQSTRSFDAWMLDNDSVTVKRRPSKEYGAYRMALSFFDEEAEEI